MSFAAQNIAIESRFHASWGTDPPVKYGNVDFTPPENAAYVQLEISDFGQNPISIGGQNVLYRNTGLISINIFVPPNTATATLNGYCDTAAAIFRGQQFSGISCYGVQITNIGEVDGRFVKNVSVDFFRDEAF